MSTTIAAQVEELILASYESMYRLAYSYTRNQDDAMDIRTDVEVLERMLEKDGLGEQGMTMGGT